jgi:hypothetical protein
MSKNYYHPNQHKYQAGCSTEPIVKNSPQISHNTLQALSIDYIVPAKLNAIGNNTDICIRGEKAFQE